MKAALVVSRPSIPPAKAARTLALAAFAAIALLASVLSAGASAAPYNFTWSSTFSTTVSGAHPNMRLSFATSSSETLQTLRVDLPAGLMHDPSGATACPAAALAADTCPSTSEIGSATTQIAVGRPTMQVPGTIYRVVDPASDADFDVAVLLRPPLSNLGLLPKLVMRDRVTFTKGGALRHTIGAIGSIPIAGGTLASRMTSMNMQFLARQPVTGNPLLSNSTHCVLGRLVATATTRAGSTGTMTSSTTPTACTTLPFSPTAKVSLGSDLVNEFTDYGVEFGVGAGTTGRGPAHISILSADLSEFGTFDLDAFDAIPGCSDAQAASTQGCPAESQIGTLTTEIAGFGARTGRVFRSTSPGHKTVAELSLRKNLVEWIKGSVEHRTSGGGAVLTVTGLPQLPFTSFRVIHSNDMHHNTFRTASTCGPVNATIQLGKFDGAATQVVSGSALHGCPPRISLVDALDMDDDDDGFANERFRPAFFDVFFDVADAGSGVESIECNAVTADGSRTRLRMTPRAQTTGRYACNAENLPEGDVTLEISASEYRGHVTVLKMGVTVDTTAPTAAFVDPADSDCDDHDPSAAICYRPAFFDIFFTATDAGSGVDWSSAVCRGITKGRPMGSSPRLIDDDGDGVPERCAIEGAEDGDYDIEISVADWRGHVTVLKMSVTIDTTAPSIAIDEPGVHFIGDPDFDLLFTVDDGGGSGVDESSVTCLAQRSGALPLKGTVILFGGRGTCSLRGLPEGELVLEISAADWRGHVTVLKHQVVVDLTGPVITLGDPEDQNCDGSDGASAPACFRPAFFDVFFDVFDEYSGVDESKTECALTDGHGNLRSKGVVKKKPAGGDYRLACEISDAIDGDAVVEIRAADWRGHVTVLKMSVTIDTTAPSIAIDEPGAHFTSDSFFDVFTELDFTIDGMSVGDPGLEPYRCEFNLDGDFDSISRPTSNCAPAGTPNSPPALDLSPGAHSVGVRVMDAAGNMS
ncbi:MAG: hypothetical protein HY827_02025, partial [Actinobacteria bacterium]|nr:hypothetical protein [Actinomycetota bacterium]